MHLIEAATNELLKKYAGGEFIGGPLYNGAGTIVNGTLSHAHVIGNSVSARVILKGWAFGKPEQSERLMWRPARGVANIILPLNVARKKDGSLEFHDGTPGIHTIIKRPGR